MKYLGILGMTREGQSYNIDGVDYNNGQVRERVLL